MRRSEAWLAREVAVCRHLVAAGAPALSPSRDIDPGPHTRDGLVLSFWEFVGTAGALFDAHAAGQALRRCHTSLEDYIGELATWGVLDEVEAILRASSTADELGSDADVLWRIHERVRRDVAGLGLPLQPVHGDAHLFNVFSSPRGPLWADWEDAFRGPIEWDLACLVASSRVFGTDAERVAAALAGYGAEIDESVLELLVEARVVQAAAWSVIVSREHPQRRDRLEARLRWLRARTS